MQQCVQSCFLIVPVFLGLVGCAGTPETPDDRDHVDPVFMVDFGEPAAEPGVTRLGPAEPDAPAERAQTLLSVRGAAAFHVQTEFVRPAGETVMAPALTVYARQRANVTVINQTAYIETFAVEVVDDAWIADPIVGILQDGIVLEMCVDGEGDDALLAYRATVSNLAKPLPQRSFRLLPESTPVTVQMPKVESNEVAGVRRIVPGATTLLATFATSSGPVELRVRVTPADIVFPDFEDRTAEAFLGLDPDEAQGFEAPGGEAFALSEWIDAGGDDLRIEVEAVVVDEGSNPSEARPLRSMEMTSRIVAGASMRASLDEAFVADYEPVGAPENRIVQPRVDTHRSGISAEIGDDGELHLAWSTAPHWPVFTVPLYRDAPLDVPKRQERVARLALMPGTWLVTLGRTTDGDTLALRVTITPAPGAQRRVASQTQATRKRLPSGVSAR